VTEETKTKQDGLAAITMSKSEFGAALIQEAGKRIQNERLQKSVEVARTILASIEECDDKIKWFSGWKKTREEQLKALEAGEFDFDRYGEITYKDAALNRR
jgi:hypothetical protein